MPIATITNGEAGSSVRAKLNAIRAALNAMGTQTQAAAAQFPGIARIAALFSAAGSTGSVTTAHLRAVMASTTSTANAARAAVIASTSCSVTGPNSASIASDGPPNDSAAGYGAVIASTGTLGIASTANRAAVIAATDGQCSERETLVAASQSSVATARNAAAIASSAGIASGTQSAVIACGGSACQSPGARSMVAASQGSRSLAADSAAIAAEICDANAARAVVLGSRRTINSVANSLAMGDNASGVALTANRKIHLFGETGNVSIAGALTPGATFSDYVELFPNGEGAPIPVGALLTLDGAAMRTALPGEEIHGVVSETGAIVAGDSAFTWARRFLRDEFGRELFDEITHPDWPAMIPDPEWAELVPDPDWQEQVLDPNWQELVPNPNWLRDSLADRREAPRLTQNPQSQGMVTNPVPRRMGENPEPARMLPNPEPPAIIRVPRQNPEWQPEVENIPRSERPAEWVKAGLLGQVFVRVDDSVNPNQPVQPGERGVATSAAFRTGLRCMELTSPFDAGRGYAVARCLINVAA